MKNGKHFVIALAIIICAIVLGRAYTYKYRSQDTIVVTGLGETEFVSDLIVWAGSLTAESQSAAAGYAQLEANKQKVQKYLTEKGIPADAVVFGFVDVDKQYESVYSANGNWAGQRFTGYMLRQRFTVESTDVEKVEVVYARNLVVDRTGRIHRSLCARLLLHEARRCKDGTDRNRIGRRPHPRRENSIQCRHQNRPRRIGPHGRIPNHGGQFQRRIFGRRFVQYIEPHEKGPHYDAHRISREIKISS